MLLSSGSGIMMAVMDVAPEFRWCADVDERGHPLDFAILINRDVVALGVLGWFSISNPDQFQKIAAATLACQVIAYGGNVSLGCVSLREFIDAANNLGRRSPEPQLSQDSKVIDRADVGENK